MFGEICSIYRNAHDAEGNYVDMETGEIIREMSLADFLLTDRWKPVVSSLRDMIAKHGAKKAKSMPEYRQMKERLPGATLSARFSLFEDTDSHGKVVMCSRRGSHLAQHTGYIVLDIDAGDNEHVANFENILRTLRHRPEVALAMRSCSGTGYFALVRLAHPHYHKEQFRALQREYAIRGITLDPACCDITRVRFASWDCPVSEGGCLYVNPDAQPYMGIDLSPQQVIAPKNMTAIHRDRQQFRTEDADDLDARVRKYISALERSGTDIAADYHDWIRIGMAFYSLGIIGLDYWKRVSAIYGMSHGKNTDTECEQKWRTFANLDGTINIQTFFWYCHENQIRIT